MFPNNSPRSTLDCLACLRPVIGGGSVIAGARGESLVDVFSENTGYGLADCAAVACAYDGGGTP